MISFFHSRLLKRLAAIAVIGLIGLLAAHPVSKAIKGSRSDPPDNEKIHRDTVVLSTAALDSAKYRQAYENLVSIALSSDENVDSLDALTILARQPRPTFSGTVRTVPVQNASERRITMSMSEIADRLERHHMSQAFHKKLALEVRVRSDPEQAGRALSPDVQH